MNQTKASLIKRLSAMLFMILITALIVFHPWEPYGHGKLWCYCGYGQNKPADVFLIGPTADLGDDTTFSTSPYEKWSRYYQLGLTNIQKGLYDDTCRVYAPYYTQACLSIYYLPEESRVPYLSRAYEDIQTAFEWYLKNENHGRPIILAGFSQGADMCLRLLRDYFDDPALQEQLVAAYIIGWRVTDDMLNESPYLKMAEGETDTGVIVAINTEADFVDDSVIVPHGVYTHGINPLTWSTDPAPADKSLNLGACEISLKGEIKKETPGLTGTYLSEKRGTLIPTDIDVKDYPPGEPVFDVGVYHNYDYVLFYRNLQRNVAVRTESYLKSHAS